MGQLEQKSERIIIRIITQTRWKKRKKDIFANHLIVTLLHLLFETKQRRTNRGNKIIRHICKYFTTFKKNELCLLFIFSSRDVSPAYVKK